MSGRCFRCRSRRTDSRSCWCTGPFHRASVVKVVRGRPARRIGGVGRGLVRERPRTPLVHENPDILRREIHQRRRSHSGHRALGRRGHLRPIGECHCGQAVTAGVVDGRHVDDVLVVEDDAAEIFQRHQTRLWLSERTGRCPSESRGQRARRRRRAARAGARPCPATG